jgi:hypothetical protein
VRLARAGKSAQPARGQCVGYIRVSTLDQREDRQLEGVKVDRRFVVVVDGVPLDETSGDVDLECEFSCVATMERASRCKGGSWM